MAVNLKTKSDKTLCGGSISSLVDYTKLTATLKFNNVKEVQLCYECPFRNMCPIERTSEIQFIRVNAFTGMEIGSLPITKETKLFIEVETKKGITIRFDRKSGVQTNCTNSRFANRVDPRDIPVWGIKK